METPDICWMLVVRMRDIGKNIYLYVIYVGLNVVLQLFLDRGRSLSSFDNILVHGVRVNHFECDIS